MVWQPPGYSERDHNTPRRYELCLDLGLGLGLGHEIPPLAWLFLVRF